MKENVIERKSFDFSLRIIELYKKLIEEKEYIISKQLLRAGTSIGANVRESGAGFSKKDFLYKMSLASKEARETKYWLELLQQSSLTNIDVKRHIDFVEELIKILTAIVKTSQQGKC